MLQKWDYSTLREKGWQDQTLSRSELITMY
jgi:hypothetical protein